MKMEVFAKAALVLVLSCVTATGRASNETEFKRLDDRVGPVIERYLKREETAFERFVSSVTAVLGERVVREKEAELARLARKLLKKYDNYNVTRGIEVRRIDRGDDADDNDDNASVLDSLVHYAKRHVIKVHFSDLIEDVSEKVKRSAGDSGRSFGIKKLMLPFMIGAQIVKSVLIAMFLPSIIGGIGRLVGKGVSTFATASNGYGQPNGMMHGQMEDFEFKDTEGYESQQYPDTHSEGSSSVFSYSYPNSPYDYSRLQQQSIGVLPGHAQTLANRYSKNSHRVTYMPNNNHHGSFYTKHHDKKQQSFKVFHNIPSSSLLLTNYDPFYSPLLSRMDSVFKQLGYETEACRERLICLMYKNPAKFAPYSNLISAQLSRELNELRKPSTDNPDILRFFKYMKAAKDGQDGADCVRSYPSCLDSRDTMNPPMVKTYNEINKLVHARKLSK